MFFLGEKKGDTYERRLFCFLSLLGYSVLAIFGIPKIRQHIAI
jgi:hypothetical protein